MEHNQATPDAEGPSGSRLHFESAFGTFSILPDAGGTYRLELSRDGRKAETLGRYMSINDAILAVLRQETGCQEWDNLGPAEMPLRIHDITSWKFSE